MRAENPHQANRRPGQNPGTRRHPSHQLSPSASTTARDRVCIGSTSLAVEYVIISLGDAVVSFPLVARGQQPKPWSVFSDLQGLGMPGTWLQQFARVCANPSDKVAIEARWADGRQERLPKLAAELVALPVAAIVGSVEAALAAKAATTSIPRSLQSMPSNPRSAIWPSSLKVSLWCS